MEAELSTLIIEQLQRELTEHSYPLKNKLVVAHFNQTLIFTYDFPQSPLREYISLVKYGMLKTILTHDVLVNLSKLTEYNIRLVEETYMKFFCKRYLVFHRKAKSYLVSSKSNEIKTSAYYYVKYLTTGGEDVLSEAAVLRLLKSKR